MKQNYRNIIFGRNTLTNLVNNLNKMLPSNADLGEIAIVEQIKVYGIR